MPSKQKQWKKTLIKTTADELLDYLADKQEVYAQEAASDLGISKASVEEWAEALADSGLIDTKYTLKGLLLKQPEAVDETVKERLTEVREDVADKLRRTKQHVDNKEGVVSDTKERLEKLGAILQKDYAESKALAKRVKKLREAEQQLETEVSNALNDVSSTLQEIEAAEEQVETFEQLRQEITEDVEVLKKLSKHSAKVEELQEKMEDMGVAEQKMDSVLARLRERLRNVFRPEKTETRNVENVLDGTVDEVKERLEDFDGDLEAVLEAEKQRDDRKTLKKHIRSKMNDV